MILNSLVTTIRLKHNVAKFVIITKKIEVFKFFYGKYFVKKKMLNMRYFDKNKWINDTSDLW